MGSGGSFVASPVAAAGKIYISSEDGDTFVVKAGPQYELLAKNPKPTEVEIRSHMDGHLCRCGTYPRVMQAIQLAGKTMTGGSP